MERSARTRSFSRSAKSALNYFRKFYIGEICGPIATIRKVAIFPFYVHFTESHRFLDLVWNCGDRKICCIYEEIGKSAVIFK